MSSFTTPADLRLLETFKWELLSDFCYHVGDYPSKEIITVPKGTITDLASVPRSLWAIYPPHGKYAKAAIVHDYLYQKQAGKEYADSIFLEGMKVLGVPKYHANVLYYVVAAFGHAAYKKHGCST
jgi:hypothetical protein